MAEENKIGLQALFEDADFQQGINSYNSSIDNAVANTDDAGSSMSQVWTGLSTVGAAAWAGLAAGIAAVTVELGFAASAAMETETVLARMEFIVASVGDRTGVTAEDVNALADSLSKVVPIDDEVIVQAITMGLTFDGVNKDNIQPLLAAAADLATFTGKDLPSTMKELALAISDPDRAMRLLKDANITLTDAEMKTLKGFKDVGDTAGATTFLLEELKNKGIIGLGEAMGDTAAGKLTIMQTALGNLQESLGAGLLDALKGVFDRITEFANNPKVIGFLTELGARIGDVVENIITKLPDMFATLEGVIEWLKNNKPIIIGILSAIGVAMAAFAINAGIAAIATAASFAPVIAVLAVIAAVVAVFVKAWQEDWGGIQGKVADALTQIKPVFEKLQAWLKVNLPKALKALSDFWVKTLLPAIKEVVAWIVDNVLPVLVKLVLWLGDNVPKAIKATSDFFNNVLLPAIKTAGDWIKNTLIPILTEMRDWFQTHIVNAIKALVSIIQGALTSALQALSNLWNNVLLPAMTAVWNFIQNYIMPLFNALANLVNAVLGLALRVLAGIWQNILLPAIQAVATFIGNIIAGFNSVVTVVRGPLGAALTELSKMWGVVKEGIQALWDKLEPFRQFLAGAFLTAVNAIRSAFNSVVTWIERLADTLGSLTLPDWLTPGSPTPLEIGLVGINAQLDKLARASLPAIRHQMEVMATVKDIPGTSASGMSNSVSNSSQSTRNYVYGASFNIPNAGGFIESLQGL
jgi:phage-related protein